MLINAIRFDFLALQTKWQNIRSNSTRDINKEIKRMSSDLRLLKSGLSSQKRKHTSTYDGAMFSVLMGVISFIVIAAVPVLVILCDYSRYTMERAERQRRKQRSKVLQERPENRNTKVEEDVNMPGPSSTRGITCKNQY